MGQIRSCLICPYFVLAVVKIIQGLTAISGSKVAEPAIGTVQIKCYRTVLVLRILAFYVFRRKGAKSS